MRIYIYSTVSVDCVWSDWVSRECSKSCGTGFRVNTRSRHVVEAHGGSCPGESVETEICNTDNCPGNHFKFYQQITTFTYPTYT